MHILRGPGTPPPALNAKRRHGHSAGFFREHEINAARPILTPSLHDIAGLQVEVQRPREVLDLQLPDVAGLVDDDAFLFQGSIERDEAASVERIRPAQEENAEVFVGAWAGDGEGIQVHGPILYI